MSEQRDGFEVVEMESGKVVHFVECKQDHPRTRERVLAGMLMNSNTDQYFIRDTRDKLDQ